MITLFGIKNCDTCRNAKKWLAENKIDFIYFDLREETLTIDLISKWKQSIGFNALVNRRGTTWRKLPEELRENFSTSNPNRIIMENPTLLKRPIIDKDGEISVGFSKEIQEKLLS